MANKQQIVSVLDEAEKEAKRGQNDTSARLLVVSIKEMLVLLEERMNDARRQQ